MSIEDKIKIVSDKLKKFDTSLTLEDQALINQNPDLIEDYIRACSHNPKFITEESFDFVVETVVGLDEGVLTEEEREQIWYNIAYTLIFVIGRYYASLIDEVLSYANVGPEMTEKIKNLEEQLLKSDNAKVPQIEMDDDTINKLLDHKSYHLISQIKSIRNVLSEATKERLIREMPQDQYPLPEVFISETKETQLREEIIEKLVKAAKKIKEHFGGLSTQKDSQKMDEEKKVRSEYSKKVLLAISKIEDFYGYEADADLYNITREMDKESQDMLEILCFQKNCFYFLWHLYSNKSVTDEDINNKARELMKQNRDIPSDLYSYLKKEFTHSDEYINYIVNKGNIPSLLGLSSPITDGVDDALIDKIIEQIKKGNPNYDKDIEEVNFDNYKYPQLLEAIIETGRVKKITLNSFDTTDTYKKLIQKLFELCPNAEIDVSYWNYEMPYFDIIIDHLIENNKLNKAAILMSGILNNCGNNSDYTQLLERVLDNYYIASYLVDHTSNAIISNHNYRNCFFKNEHLLSLLLDKVNHNEGYYGFYSHEVFELIKEVLSKKYGLELQKLEMMEQAFGPLVIRYIENDNIQSMIKLGEEDFQKLLSLFPKTTFDLIDVQAAYDSLIQNMFAKTNPDIVNIYGIFIQALDQENIEVISKIKETLVINTSIEFMAKLLVDYGLPDFNDVNEFISFLIEAYKNDKEGIKRIIHDLTNELILNKRKEFHNNHYLAEKYSREYNIFNRLLKAIEEKDSMEEFIIKNDLSSALNHSFFDQFTKDKEIPEDCLTPLDLMEIIIEKIKDPDKRIKYLPLLKEITDYYISRKIEEHKKELTIGNELGLPYTIDEPKAEKEYYKYLIAHSYNYYIYDTDTHKCKFLYNVIIEELEKEGISKRVTEDCLAYYSNPENPVNDVGLVRNVLKKVIPTAIRIIKENEYRLESNEYRAEDLKAKIIEHLDEMYRVNRIYTVEDPDVDIYQILADLNVELLQNNVFNNEEVLQKLQSIMAKRKLHLLPGNLKKLVEQCNISSNFTNISAFINFFAHILEEEKKLLLASGKDPKDALTSLAIILTRADTYSSLSSVYTQILGSEDAKLIKSNPGPNSACMKIKNNQRLNEAIKITTNLYKRQEVTIPPYDKTFEFPSDNGTKSLNVIAGNFTDPCNLTHGERTGACMRIGGVGETLFNFCLNNPNGFHIRFEDPETREYISRVSGFRNGNTVFLNELRYSCNNKKYSNADVVTACKLAAQELINLSKDSECPIENVVIAKEYAIRDVSDAKVEDLHVTNIKEGLPGFYSDVGSKAVVLATTSEPFAPLKFNKTKVPTYKPCRGKIEYLYNSSVLVNKINRVKSIKALLNGVSHEDLEQFEFPNGVIYGIVADDWYIYLDRNMNLSYDSINVDHRAVEELATHLQIIEEMIKKNQIEVKDDEYVL